MSLPWHLAATLGRWSGWRLTCGAAWLQHLLPTASQTPGISINLHQAVHCSYQAPPCSRPWPSVIRPVSSAAGPSQRPDSQPGNKPADSKAFFDDSAKARHAPKKNTGSHQPEWLHILMRKRQKREAVQGGPPRSHQPKPKLKKNTGRVFPPAPAELTAQITSARDLAALVSICKRHSPGGQFQTMPLGPLHVTALFSRASRLASRHANTNTAGLAAYASRRPDQAQEPRSDVDQDRKARPGDAASQDTLLQLRDMLCMRLFQILDKMDALGTCHVVWCMGKLRLKSDPVLLEAIQQHLCQQVLVPVTDIASTSAAAGKQAHAPPDSSNGGGGRSGADDTSRAARGGPEPRTWVPRVYLASTDSLVRLFTGLSGLGVRLTPSWQPVLAAAQRHANAGTLTLRQLATLLLAARRCQAGWDTELVDALAACFMAQLPEQVLQGRDDAQPLWALATCCQTLHALGLRSERLALAAAAAAREYLADLKSESRSTPAVPPQRTGTVRNRDRSSESLFPLAMADSNLLAMPSAEQNMEEKEEEASSLQETDEHRHGRGNSEGSTSTTDLSEAGDREDREQLRRTLRAWGVLDLELNIMLSSRQALFRHNT